MTLTTPELPEGFFFRVTKRDNPHSTYPLTVELRRKRFIGSTEIDSWPAMNTPKDIHQSMLWVLEHQQKIAEARNTTSTLLGDYPPKTLEHR